MKRCDNSEHNHEMMIEAIRGKREDDGRQPTQYRVPENKLLCCYAIASLRKKGIRPEQVGSVMAVLLWLVKHANPSSGRCDPSVAKLAIETGYSRSTIIRALETAEDVGYLIKEGRDGRTSAYHLNFRDMITDFLKIEEEAKRRSEECDTKQPMSRVIHVCDPNEERHTNPPMSRVTHPHVTGDTGTHVTGDTLKHKGESVKGNAYPKGEQSPSATSSTPLVENKKGFSEEDQNHFSANQTTAEARVESYIGPFERLHITPEARQEAVAAELREVGSGRAIVKRAANEAWKKQRMKA
jgi:hypothetical protein